MKKTFKTFTMASCTQSLSNFKKILSIHMKQNNCNSKAKPPITFVLARSTELIQCQRNHSQ